MIRTNLIIIIVLIFANQAYAADKNAVLGDLLANSHILCNSNRSYRNMVSWGQAEYIFRHGNPSCIVSTDTSSYKMAKIYELSGAYFIHIQENIGNYSDDEIGENYFLINKVASALSLGAVKLFYDKDKNVLEVISKHNIAKSLLPKYDKIEEYSTIRFYKISEATKDYIEFKMFQTTKYWTDDGVNNNSIQYWSEEPGNKKEVPDGYARRAAEFIRNSNLNLRPL